MARPKDTLTDSQSLRRAGAISGFVLKLARRCAGVTQEQLAEDLRVDPTTVQGWESGRRPLSALSSSELARVRMHLNRGGAPASLAKDLSQAIEADILLGSCINLNATQHSVDAHPLGAVVHRRSLMNLVTWPITGALPDQLTSYTPRMPSKGPAASYPCLSKADLDRFFDHLQVLTDRTKEPGHALTRRQAVYLLGFDHRTSTISWLRDEWRRVNPKNNYIENINELPEARSAAISLASTGDESSLHCFVSRLADDRQRQANLNYWAYWIGEISNDQINDRFMLCTDPWSWGGVQLLEHLTRRLGPSSKHLALNLQTMHALVETRPSLLTDWPRLRAPLATTIERIGSQEGLGRRIRDEIAGLSYALRITAR